MKRFILGFSFGCLLTTAAYAGNLSEAKWIGTPGNVLPFYPDNLSVFKIDFDVSGLSGSSVTLIYGKNDPRLMNPNLNIYGIGARTDESEIKISINEKGDISIYRISYHPDDKPDQPIAVFSSRHFWSPDHNHITISSNLGNTVLLLNGNKIGEMGINPLGNGGDFISFPVLAEMAFEVSGEAEISNLTISNLREPSNPLFIYDKTINKSEKIPLQIRRMPILTTSFSLDGQKTLESASIDITARGIYDVIVNGERVTKDYFYPGCTQYNKTHLYNSFDLTPFLQENNYIDVQLCEGWWSGPSTYMGEYWNFYGDQQSLLANITINYNDGTKTNVVTSPNTWKYTLDTPVIVGSFFQGEIFNANADRSKAAYYPAVEVSLEKSSYPFSDGWKEINLRESFGDRVSAVDTLTAIAMTEPRKGIFIYDFGQNFAGVPHITFTSLPKNTEVGLRYAEVLYPDMDYYADNKGMIMTENIRAAMNHDAYISSGDTVETFSPRFTLHGFRFLELTGIPEPLPLENVKGIVLSSIKDFNAKFECSDTLVNRLWENIKWSTRSNFISLPTDCPQRNERLGWMGDISVYSPTATKLANISPLLQQYLQAIRDCQSPEGKYPNVAPTDVGFGGLLWESAGITVPYEVLKQYGDTLTVRQHYPSMKRYIDYVYKHYIDKNSGIIVQNHAWSDLGDWLSPEYEKNDKSLLWECYLIYDLDIMSYIAKVLGYVDDSENFAKLACERRAFFNKTYVDPRTYKTRFSSYNPGKEGEEVDTQVSYALPIAMGIVNDYRFTQNFLNNIIRENVSDDGKPCPPYSLMTGFIGTAWIQKALTITGNYDIAYKILTNTDYPSWLYPVTQGATTIWERLNSYTHSEGFGNNNSMNSFNHYSFGSVGDWLLTGCIGINSNNEGIILSPIPDVTGLITYAKGELITPHGLAKCGWERIDDKTFEFEIDIPVCSTFIFPDGTIRNLPKGASHIVYTY